MSDQSERLKARTRQFVLDVFKLLPHLPPGEPGPTIRRQLARSATSVDMNYRAACRGRSRAEFVATLGTVAEEADESAEWLDVIAQARLTAFAGLDPLRKESRELLAIFSASVGTARRNLRE
jgi:four helix bundle protein